MKAVFDKYKRIAVFYIAVFPLFGRSLYERLSSRLDRQISIRERRRQRKFEFINEYPETNIYNELDRLIYKETELSQVRDYITNDSVNLLTLR